MTTRSELTGRERVRLALEHRPTDRIPIAMVCSGINEPTRTAFDEHVRRTRGRTLASFLGDILDVRNVDPPYVGPTLAPGRNYWGVERTAVSHGQGVYHEISHYPLADAASLDDVERYAWPDVEWFDYDALPEHIRSVQNGGERCIVIGNGNIFESSWYLRGFERMFMDMVLDPPLAHAILRHVADFFVEHFRRVLQAGRGEINLIFTADDIGGQNGLLMSLPMWEEFIQPHHRRLNAVIHEFGVRVIYHSDGAVMDAIPGLLDMGVDVLQALQFDAAGMDAAEMKRLYGDRLCFEGGVSVQSTLPFGTPDDVREEVRGLIATLGRDGGYILGPSHVIQAGTPTENIDAIFETALSFYPHA